MRGTYRIASQVQVECASNVHPVGSGKESECTANAWVNIQYLVLSVALVVSVSDIENTLVPDGFHEFGCRPFDGLITNTDSQTRDTCVRRKASDLLAGHAKDASGILIEIAVKHPVFAGDEFLN